MKFKYLIIIFILLSINGASAWVTDDISASGYYHYESTDGEGIIVYWVDASTLPKAELYSIMSIRCTSSIGNPYAKNTIEALDAGGSNIEQYVCDCDPEEGCDYYHSLENLFEYGGGAGGSKQYRNKYAEYNDPATRITCISTSFHLWVDMDIFNATGNTCGLSYVDLYAFNGTAYNYVERDDLSSDNEYLFEVHNTTQYRLDFSDDHQYLFTCSEDIIYDRNVCSYITLNFTDNCDNLICKTAGTYYNSGDPIALNFYALNGTYDISFSNPDYLEIWVDSAIGTLYYNISNPQDNSIIIYTLQNPTISWNNNILVHDGNTSLPIESALVIFSQDCIINPTTYPVRNKFTDVNGFANFNQCELNSFSLGVSAANYQSFFNSSISSESLDAFNLEQTIIIELYALDDEENESEYIYTDYGTWIRFKDVDGNYTTTILDTDNYVDLYYYNNNSDSEPMTLKFQKYSVGTGIADLLSWNIPNNTDGYKRILKSNYTDTSYLYIGCLYNYSLDGWDKIKYLNVRNETSETDLDYENLSAFVWFRNKNVEGSIDYREDINIVAYANSSYIDLLEISLELYDNTSFITHTNLTWADFIGADLKYFYEWNPSYSYINGHNYTVRMHGYDYYLLSMDYINASDYRKNKLTINVKNQDGIPLDNAFVFLEDYGSLSTGVNHYNSYEGLNNGYYRFKATKPDYTGTGWDDITLSDGDKTVTYILTWSDSEEGGAMQSQKIDDTDLNNIYLIFMTIVLIFVILGGFLYAIK
jgi:hypothetical protein